MPFIKRSLIPDPQKREGAGPNEIVACTTCGGTSPCTHSANNGCATEVGNPFQMHLIETLYI